MLDCRTGSLSRSRLSQRKSVDSDIFLWVHLINHCTGIECSREAKVDNSALKCIDQIVLRVPAAKICRSMSTKLCLTASERRNRAKSSQFAFGNRKTFAGIEIAETPTGKIINHQTAALCRRRLMHAGNLLTKNFRLYCNPLLQTILITDDSPTFKRQRNTRRRHGSMNAGQHCSSSRHAGIGRSMKDRLLNVAGRQSIGECGCRSALAKILKPQTGGDRQHSQMLLSD